MAKRRGGMNKIAAEPEALAKLQLQLEAIERARAEGTLKKPHERRILRRRRAELLTKLRATARSLVEARLADESNES